MSSAGSLNTDRFISHQRDFDIWATVYDEHPNPLLLLEQRFLQQLLPSIEDRHILDLGCGTGRWLKFLASKSPASLTGIDPSSEMLRRSATKSIPGAGLRQGTCTEIPVATSSIDLVLASFVLSHVQDIDGMIREIDRITSLGAHVVLTDMHPDTEAKLHWKRSFNCAEQQFSLQTYQRSLHQIARLFESSGFEVRLLIEPSFGTTEKSLFEENGKLHAYQAAMSLPAIYILQLQKRSSKKPLHLTDEKKNTVFQLEGAICALGPSDSASASIAVEDGMIRWMSSRPTLHRTVSSEDILDLRDYLLLPGLINAHDHLEFSLFPRLGRGPYKNAHSWAEDIHRSFAATIAFHNSIPKRIRLWWGGIRNLLCGVTTVCHHNPLSRDLRSQNFPIKVLSKFGWAHSLYVDKEITEKFQSTPDDLPFIIHAAEGVDGQSEEEVFELDKMQALTERIILVHGLALTHDSIELINQKKASLIICPTSNHFLFKRFPKIQLLNSVDKLALGSDSPLTAAGDLLDELRFAIAEIGLSSEALYEMVTTRAASILRLQNGEGQLRPDGVADLIAVRHDGSTPAHTLTNLTFDQIELVVVAGRIQLASSVIYERMQGSLKQGLQRFEVAGKLRWVRAPIDSLFSESRKHIGQKPFSIGRKRVSPMSVSKQFIYMRQHARQSLTTF